MTNGMQDFADKKDKKKPLKKLGKGLGNVGKVALQNQPAAIVGRTVKGGKPVKIKPQDLKKTLKQTGTGAVVGLGIATAGAAATNAGGTSTKAMAVRKNGNKVTPILKGGKPVFKSVDSVMKSPEQIGKDLAKETVGKAIDNVVPGVQKDVLPEQVNPLLMVEPLKPAMKVGLKEKGLTPSKGTESLSRQFYDNVIKGSNMADSDNVSKKVLADAIVNYFIRAKQKKDSGAELSPMEKVAAAGFEVADEQAGKAKDQAISDEIGGFVMEKKTIIIGVAIVVFIIVVMYFSKRGK